ncbi:MAG: iron ABC transporter permease [Verrucomicrobiales bacterium]|nr:iron ABC transporter permease [Verrucomicrobiales bacterium]
MNSAEITEGSADYPFRFRLSPPGRWGLFVGAVSLCVALPLFAVLLFLLQPGPEWAHLQSTVLIKYLGNTLLLLVSVLAVSFLMGVPAAWLVSTVEFPGRRFFSWALVLPLAIPTYVAAFVYFEGPEAAIPLLVKVRTQWGVDAFLACEAIIRYGLLILLLSSVLFPYLFLGARSAFLQQGRDVLEASRCLGSSPRRTFFRIALPLARPGIVAGGALVGMEVINEYGAVHFFGVPTLTEGIFRTWFGMNDKASALRLAAIVMIAVLVFLAAEKALRGRAHFTTENTCSHPPARRRLRGAKQWAAFVICLLPFVLGFLYPVIRLLTWAVSQVEAGSPVFPSVPAILRGTAVATTTAIVVTGFAALFAYAVRLRQSRSREMLARIATLGYAIPGAVVAVGVMAFFGFVDRSEVPGLPVLGGTLFAISFAYFVRFFAIPNQLSHAGLDRIGRGVEEASRVLGHGPLQTFLRVNLPLLRGPLFAAAILLFVDLLKELPLTMILRPANFETLSTSAFSLAKEGRMHACSVPSLLIVLIGGIGLFLMNRRMDSDIRP